MMNVDITGKQISWCIRIGVCKIGELTIGKWDYNLRINNTESKFKIHETLLVQQWNNKMALVEVGEVMFVDQINLGRLLVNIIVYQII